MATGIGAAAACPVADATGRRVQAIPLTPLRVLELMLCTKDTAASTRARIVMTRKNDDRLSWHFEARTPAGVTQCRFEADPAELAFRSDNPVMNVDHAVRWDEVAEGATAVMTGMGGRGAPDFPSWVPERLEWVVLSRAHGAPGIMWPLPPGSARDELIALLRARLGPRWIGEGLPLEEARKRMSIVSSEWSRLKIVGIVVGVLALSLLSLVLIGVLLRPVIFVPIGLAGGGWLIYRGWQGRRDSDVAADVPRAGGSNLQPGLVRLEGQVIAAVPLRTPVTDLPSVWWDASIDVWYEGDSDEVGGWRQLVGRYAGDVETLGIQTAGGMLSIWLDRAELLLEQRQWESGKDVLPAAGLAWLHGLGYDWGGERRLRVNEQSMNIGSTIYVVGTLGLRRDVPDAVTDSVFVRAQRAIRSGSWRKSVVTAMPLALRPVIAIFIGFVDMLTGIGTARNRPTQLGGLHPPVLDPNALLIWKGRAGHPLLVSDQPEHAALDSLRKRSLIRMGLGLVVMCFVIATAFE